MKDERISTVIITISYYHQISPPLYLPEQWNFLYVELSQVALQHPDKDSSKGRGNNTAALDCMVWGDRSKDDFNMLAQLQKVTHAWKSLFIIFRWSAPGQARGPQAYSLIAAVKLSSWVRQKHRSCKSPFWLPLGRNSWQSGVFPGGLLLW